RLDFSLVENRLEGIAAVLARQYVTVQTGQTLIQCFPGEKLLFSLIRNRDLGATNAAIRGAAALAAGRHDHWRAGAKAARVGQGGARHLLARGSLALLVRTYTR